MPKLQAAQRISGSTSGTNDTSDAPARQPGWQIRTPGKARQVNSNGLRHCAEQCFSLIAPQALRLCRNDVECVCSLGDFQQATLICVYDNCSAYAFSQADANQAFPAVVDDIFDDCTQILEVPRSPNDPDPDTDPDPDPEPPQTTRSHVPTVWTEPPPSPTSSRTPTSPNNFPNGVPSGSPNDSSNDASSGSGSSDGSSNNPLEGVLGSSDGGSSIGAIVGGVLGGLVIIALVVGLVFFLIRRSRQPPRAAANYTPYTPDPPSSGSATPPGYVQGPVPVLVSDAKRRVAMAEAYPGPSFSEQHAHTHTNSAYTGIERTTSPGVGLVGPGVARTMSVYSGAVSVNPPSTADGEDEGQDRTRRQ